MGRFDSFLSNTISNIEKVTDFVKEKSEVVKEKSEVIGKELDKKIEKINKEQEEKRKEEEARKQLIESYDSYIKPILEIVERDRVLFKNYDDRNDTRNLCIHLLKENVTFITTLGEALKQFKSGAYEPSNNENLIIPRNVFGFTESANNNRKIIMNGIDALNRLLTSMDTIEGKFEITVLQVDNIVDKPHKEIHIFTSDPDSAPRRESAEAIRQRQARRASANRRSDIMAAKFYTSNRSNKEKFGYAMGDAAGRAAAPIIEPLIDLTFKAVGGVLDLAIEGAVAVTSKNEGDHEYQLKITRIIS